MTKTPNVFTRGEITPEALRALVGKRALIVNSTKRSRCFDSKLVSVSPSGEYAEVEGCIPENEIVYWAASATSLRTTWIQVNTIETIEVLE